MAAVVLFHLVLVAKYLHRNVGSGAAVLPALNVSVAVAVLFPLVPTTNRPCKLVSRVEVVPQVNDGKGSDDDSFISQL